MWYDWFSTSCLTLFVTYVDCCFFVLRQRIHRWVCSTLLRDLRPDLTSQWGSIASDAENTRRAMRILKVKSTLLFFSGWVIKSFLFSFILRRRVSKGRCGWGSFETWRSRSESQTGGSCPLGRGRNSQDANRVHLFLFQEKCQLLKACLNGQHHRRHSYRCFLKPIHCPCPSCQTLDSHWLLGWRSPWMSFRLTICKFVLDSVEWTAQVRLGTQQLGFSCISGTRFADEACLFNSLLYKMRKRCII